LEVRRGKKGRNDKNILFAHFKCETPTDKSWRSPTNAKMCDLGRRLRSKVYRKRTVQATEGELAVLEVTTILC
jgi:hypothetical protein